MTTNIIFDDINVDIGGLIVTVSEGSEGGNDGFGVIWESKTANFIASFNRIYKVVALSQIDISLPIVPIENSSFWVYDGLSGWRMIQRALERVFIRDVATSIGTSGFCRQSSKGALTKFTYTSDGWIVEPSEPIEIF